MVKFAKIAFCTDFSELADVAFEYACGFAQSNQSELHILHVTSEPPVREKLQQMFQKKYLEAPCYQEKGQGLKTECIFRQGMDHEEIIKYVKEADVDLIVMGTHGESGFLDAILAGSCAKKVVWKSPVPVFVVPPPEKRGN